MIDIISEKLPRPAKPVAGPDKAIAPVPPVFKSPETKEEPPESFRAMLEREARKRKYKEPGKGGNVDITV